MDWIDYKKYVNCEIHVSLEWMNHNTWSMCFKCHRLYRKKDWYCELQMWNVSMFIAFAEYDVASMFDWCSLASMFIAFD